jgi:hypothetical protein
MALTRYQSPLEGKRFGRLPAAALRAVLREGYTRQDLKHDVLAGVVVGMVALPLAMALAIGVGVPPQHGLYTAIVAGGPGGGAGRIAHAGDGSHRGVHRHPGARSTRGSAWEDS